MDLSSLVNCIAMVIVLLLNVWVQFSLRRTKRRLLLDQERLKNRVRVSGGRIFTQKEIGAPSFKDAGQIDYELLGTGSELGVRDHEPCAWMDEPPRVKKTKVVPPNSKGVPRKKKPATYDLDAAQFSEKNWRSVSAIRSI